MFNPSAYGARVSSILALDGNGERLMPLAKGTCSSAAAYKLLAATTARDLFASARSPNAAMAGLHIYFSCMEEAHNLAQDIETAEGSFWHGILHRQEPDAGNAAYWFRRIGRHAIFPELRDAAAELGYPARDVWDPFVFIDACEEARRRPDSDQELLMKRVQLAEWQLLFDYCARTSS